MTIPVNTYTAQNRPWPDYPGPTLQNIYAPAKLLAYYLNAYAGAGFDCPTIQGLFDSINAQIAGETVARFINPGNGFHTSQVEFIADPGSADGVYSAGLVYQPYPNIGVSVTPPGNWDVTVSGGVVTSVVDNYNRTINFTDNDSFVLPDEIVPGFGLYITSTGLQSRISGSVSAINNFKQAFMDYYVPACAVTPPEPPAAPTLTKLPKFANFAMPINPFGIPRK